MIENNSLYKKHLFNNPCLIAGSFAGLSMLALVFISLWRVLRRDIYEGPDSVLHWFIHCRLRYTLLFSAVLSVLVFFVVLWIFWDLKTESHKKCIVKGIFVMVTLLLAILLADKQGAMDDMYAQRYHCLVCFKHLFTSYCNDTPYLWGFPRLETYTYRYYGVAIQMPVTFFEALLHFSISVKAVYYIRNLYNFFIFAVGTVAFYYLTRDMFGQKTAALAGLMYILNPRIFPSAFTNMKDTVFMSLLSIGLYVFYHVICSDEKICQSSVLKILGLSAITAFMINSRTIGGLLAIAGEVYFAVMFFRSRSAKKYYALSAFLYFIFSVMIFILITPASWMNPIDYLIGNLTTFSDYTDWDSYNLYMGQRIRGAEMPWHYVPVMIFISTPLLYQLMIIAGTVLAVCGILRKTIEKWTAILMTAIGFILFTFLYIVIKHPTLYREWRHFYYLWPCFIIMAAVCLDWLLHQKKVIKRIGLILAGIGILHIAAYMVITFPHEANFHNIFVRNYNADNYNLLGARPAYREGVNYIVENYYQGEPLLIKRADNVDLYLFKKSILNSVEFVEEDEEFIVRTFPREIYDKKYKDYTEIYSKTVAGLEIFRIYKRL